MKIPIASGAKGSLMAALPPRTEASPLDGFGDGEGLHKYRRKEWVTILGDALESLGYTYTCMRLLNVLMSF